MANKKQVTSVVSDIVRGYWQHYPDYIIDNYIERHAFEIILLIDWLGRCKAQTVVDVGGGWGAFAAACSKLGFKAILVDDFGDPGKSYGQDPRQKLPEDYNVKIIQRNVIEEGFGFPSESVDAVTSFGMIEHLHASPRKFLHGAMKALRPNGLLLLSAPNCVNLRKRITVPFGRGGWSDFAEWYNYPVFRGHVREPDVSDLRKIAEDLNLVDWKVIGRNWMGRESSNPLIRNMVSVAEIFLRALPSLCSNLYLLGYKK